jgi:hypothetical protein
MNENTDTNTIPPLHICPQCGKGFSSAQGLRMHNARVHTKTLGTGYKWKGEASEQERLERRRAYQKKLRARYYRQGKNSRGEAMPPGWTPLKRRKRTTPPWTAERHVRHLAKYPQQPRGKERIQIVYPDPRDIDLQKVAQQVTRAVIRFCPYCGENIEKQIK